MPHFSHSRPPMTKPLYLLLDKPNTILNDLSQHIRPIPKPLEKVDKVHPKKRKAYNFPYMYFFTSNAKISNQ